MGEMKPFLLNFRLSMKREINVYFGESKEFFCDLQYLTELPISRFTELTLGEFYVGIS